MRSMVFLAGCLLISTVQQSFAGSHQNRNLLAVSWQSAFCETRPGKPECRSRTTKLYTARNFALHGLWPQPRGNDYCGVSDRLIDIDKSGRWSRLPRLELHEKIRKTLNTAMPGVRSDLQRHEWIKHGTCFSKKPDKYYAASLILLIQLNKSNVARYFERNIGKFIRADAIRSEVDKTFGKGAGDRVEIRCKKVNGRKLITELWIALNGSIKKGTKLGDLMRQAKRRSRGCNGGIVDPVGIHGRG